MSSKFVSKIKPELSIEYVIIWIFSYSAKDVINFNMFEFRSVFVRLSDSRGREPFRRKEPLFQKIIIL